MLQVQLQTYQKVYQMVQLKLMVIASKQEQYLSEQNLILMKNGQFRVGPMYSSGGTQDSRGYYGNQDVCFDKAIMVNYGLEIYGNNDSAEGISYIDFHSGSDVTTGDSLYDYTGRLQNYLAPNGNSAFTFSGSKTVAGTTVGTCTVAVNGTLVHSSDRRLKEKTSAS